MVQSGSKDGSGCPGQSSEYMDLSNLIYLSIYLEWYRVEAKMEVAVLARAQNTWIVLSIPVLFSAFQVFNVHFKVKLF